MPFNDVDSLSDDAAQPANPSTPKAHDTKAKAKAKGKAKAKSSPKAKAKSSPKPRTRKGRTILEKMKREDPVESSGVLPTATSPEVKKRGRPKAKAEPKTRPFKRPAAGTAGGSGEGKGAAKGADSTKAKGGSTTKKPACAELSVCKYRYKEPTALGDSKSEGKSV